MSRVEELHNRAMDCAERGEKLLKTSPGEARAAYAEGLSWELQAIEQLGQADDLTLAVFTRSAAALALGAQNYGEVRRLVARGLKVAPPAIRAELEALLDSPSLPLQG